MHPIFGLDWELASLPWNTNYKSVSSKIGSEREELYDDSSAQSESNFFSIPLSKSLQLYDLILNQGLIVDDNLHSEKEFKPFTLSAGPEVKRLEEALNVNKILSFILAVVTSADEVNIFGQSIHQILGCDYILKAYEANKIPSHLRLNSKEIEKLYKTDENLAIEFILKNSSQADLIAMGEKLIKDLNSQLQKLKGFKVSGKALKKFGYCITVAGAGTIRKIKFCNTSLPSVKLKKKSLFLTLTYQSLKSLEKKLIVKKSPPLPINVKNFSHVDLLLYVSKRVPISKIAASHNYFLVFQNLLKGKLCLFPNERQTFFPLWKMHFSQLDKCFIPVLFTGNVKGPPAVIPKHVLTLQKSVEFFFTNFNVDTAPQLLEKLKFFTIDSFKGVPAALVAMRFNLCSLLQRNYVDNEKYFETRRMLLENIEKNIQSEKHTLPVHFAALQELILDKKLPFTVLLALIQVHGHLLEGRRKMLRQDATINYCCERDGDQEIHLLNFENEGINLALEDNLTDAMALLLEYANSKENYFPPKFHNFFLAFFEGISQKNFLNRQPFNASKEQLAALKNVASVAVSFLAHEPLRLLGYLLLAHCQQLGKLDRSHLETLIENLFPVLHAQTNPGIRLAIMQQFLNVMYAIQTSESVFHSLDRFSDMKDVQYGDVLFHDINRLEGLLRQASQNHESELALTSSCMHSLAFCSQPELYKLLLDKLKGFTSKIILDLAPKMIDASLHSESLGVPHAIQIVQILLESKQISYGIIEKCVSQIFTSCLSQDGNHAKLIINLDRLAAISSAALSRKGKNEGAAGKESFYFKLCPFLIENIPEEGALFLEKVAAAGLFSQNLSELYSYRLNLCRMHISKKEWTKAIESIEKALISTPSEGPAELVEILINIDVSQLTDDQKISYRRLLMKCCVPSLSNTVSQKLLKPLAKITQLIENNTNDPQRIKSFLPIGKWLLFQLSKSDYKSECALYLEQAKKLKIDFDSLQDDDDMASALGACAFSSYIDQLNPNISSIKQSPESSIMAVAKEFLESSSFETQVNGFSLYSSTAPCEAGKSLLPIVIEFIPKLLKAEMSLVWRKEHIQRFSRHVALYKTENAIELALSQLLKLMTASTMSTQDLLTSYCRAFCTFDSPIIFNAVFCCWQKIHNNSLTVALELVEEIRKAHPLRALKILLAAGAGAKVPYNELEKEFKLLGEQIEAGEKSGEVFDAYVSLTLLMKGKCINDEQRKFISVHIFSFSECWLLSHPQKSFEMFILASSLATPEMTANYAEALLRLICDHSQFKNLIQTFSAVKVIDKWLEKLAPGSLSSSSKDLLRKIITQLLTDDQTGAEKILDELLNKQLVTSADAKLIDLQICLANIHFESNRQHDALNRCGRLILLGCHENVACQILLWEAEGHTSEFLEKMLQSCDKKLPDFLLTQLAIKVTSTLNLLDRSLNTTKLDLLNTKCVLLASALPPKDENNRDAFTALMVALAKNGIDIAALLDRIKFWHLLQHESPEPILSLLKEGSMPSDEIDELKAAFYFSQAKLLIKKPEEDPFPLIKNALSALGKSKFALYECMELIIGLGGKAALLEKLNKLSSWSHIAVEKDAWKDLLTLLTICSQKDAAEFLIDRKAELLELANHQNELIQFAESLSLLLIQSKKDSYQSLALQLQEISQSYCSVFWLVAFRNIPPNSALRKKMILRIIESGTSFVGQKNERYECWFALLTEMNNKKSVLFESLILRCKEILAVCVTPQHQMLIKRQLVKGFIRLLGAKDLERDNLILLLGLILNLNRSADASKENMQKIAIVTELLKFNKIFRLEVAIQILAQVTTELDVCAQLTDLVISHVCFNDQKLDPLLRAQLTAMALKQNKKDSQNINLVMLFRFFLMPDSGQLYSEAFTIALGFLNASLIREERLPLTMLFENLIVSLSNAGDSLRCLTLLRNPQILHYLNPSSFSTYFAKNMLKNFESLEECNDPKEIAIWLTVFCHFRLRLQDCENENKCQEKFHSLLFKLLTKFNDVENFQRLFHMDFQNAAYFNSEIALEEWGKAEDNMLLEFFNNLKFCVDPTLPTNRDMLKKHIKMASENFKYNPDEIYKHKSNRILLSAIPNVDQEEKSLSKTFARWIKQIRSALLKCKTFTPEAHTVIFTHLMSLFTHLVRFKYGKETGIALLALAYRHTSKGGVLAISHMEMCKDFYSYFLNSNDKLTKKRSIGSSLHYELSLLFQINPEYLQLSEQERLDIFSLVLANLTNVNDNIKIDLALSTIISQTDIFLKYIDKFEFSFHLLCIYGIRGISPYITTEVSESNSLQELFASDHNANYAFTNFNRIADLIMAFSSLPEYTENQLKTIVEFLVFWLSEIGKLSETCDNQHKLFLYQVVLKLFKTFNVMDMKESGLTKMFKSLMQELDSNKAILEVFNPIFGEFNIEKKVEDKES